MFQIRVDLSQFQAQMEAHKASMPKAMRMIRGEIGLVVETEAKRHLYSGHGLKTGRLKRSIRIKHKARSTFVEPHTNYAGFLHDGTRPSPGRFVPALGKRISTGMHPGIRNPIPFMEFGAKKGEREAQRIANSVLTKFFGGR